MLFVCNTHTTQTKIRRKSITRDSTIPERVPHPENIIRNTTILEQGKFHTTQKYSTKNKTYIQHVNKTSIQHELHTTQNIQHKVEVLGAGLEELRHSSR